MRRDAPGVERPPPLPFRSPIHTTTRPPHPTPTHQASRAALCRSPLPFSVAVRRLTRQPLPREPSAVRTSRRTPSRGCGETRPGWSDHRPCRSDRQSIRPLDHRTRHPPTKPRGPPCAVRRSGGGGRSQRRRSSGDREPLVRRATPDRQAGGASSAADVTRAGEGRAGIVDDSGNGNGTRAASGVAEAARTGEGRARIVGGPATATAPGRRAEWRMSLGPARVERGSSMARGTTTAPGRRAGRRRRSNRRGSSGSRRWLGNGEKGMARRPLARYTGAIPLRRRAWRVRRPSRT
jgi:hypothetical protein